MCVSVCMSWCTCGSERRICGSLFYFPSNLSLIPWTSEHHTYAMALLPPQINLKCNFKKSLVMTQWETAACPPNG